MTDAAEHDDPADPEPPTGGEGGGTARRPTGGPGHGAPSRRVLAAIVAPLVVLVVAAQVGDALAPTLVDTHPLLLITLNSRTRNLVLVVNQLDPVSFYAVATVRLLVSDPLFYLLGWFYGDAAVHWLERRSATVGRYARQFERFFQKAAYPLVAIAPNNPICLLAGASGMRPVVFFSLNLAGTIVRLWLIDLFGETFEEPIDWVLDLVKEYRWFLLAITVTLVTVTVLREARAGGTEVQQLRQLEDELTDDAVDLDARPDTDETGR